MILSEKIKAFRAEKNWTQDDLAKFSGVSLPSIKRYETGKENITTTNLKKIAEAFGVEATEFMSHNMSHKGVPQCPTKVSHKETSHDLSFTDENSLYIRTINSRVGAGESVEIDGISVIDSGECVAFSTLLFKTPPKLENLRAMQVSGYSMIPMLYPDSWVIVEISPVFEGDGLYVIDFGGAFMVKMVQRSPNGALDIISTNKEYKSYRIDAGDETSIKIIGKVLRCII